MKKLIIIPVFLFAWSAFAGDSSGFLESAISKGCGDSVNSSHIKNEDLRMVAECYQAGLDEVVRREKTMVGVAVHVCSKLESNEQANCIRRFSRSANDAEVTKLVGTCNYRSGNSKGSDSVGVFLQCVRDEKEKFKQFVPKYKRPSDFEKTYKLAEAVAYSCGRRENSTRIENNDVSAMAECYRAGMDNLRNQEMTVLRFGVSTCAKFDMNFKRVFCMERFAVSSHDPNMKKMVDACKDVPKKGMWVTAMYEKTEECLKEQSEKYPHWRHKGNPGEGIGASVGGSAK